MNLLPNAPLGVPESAAAIRSVGARQRPARGHHDIQGLRTGFSCMAQQPVQKPVRLKVEGLAKSFGGVAALRKMDLEARAGQILSVIGPNGAGKTTLINGISGVYPTDQGTVELDGEKISGLAAYQVAQRGIA